jgi:hypothetical protein
MMESGDAYMQMEQMVAARPQKSFRPCPCSASSDTSTTMVNTAATPDARPSVRSRVFRLDANTRKITTYTASIADPAPLIVDTRMLFGDTNGRPYQAERRQFRSVMLYGTPEKSSVDFLLMILQKVGLSAKKYITYLVCDFGYMNKKSFFLGSNKNLHRG